MHKLITQELYRANGDKRLVRKFEKYRAYLFFVSGQYKQALASFDKAGIVAPFNNLYKTCEKYAQLKSDDELLLPEDFAELLVFSYRNSGLRKKSSFGQLSRVHEKTESDGSGKIFAGSNCGS